MAYLGDKIKKQANNLVKSHTVTPLLRRDIHFLSRAAGTYPS